jgi:fibronectin type 3 domain-containing protein
MDDAAPAKIKILRASVSGGKPLAIGEVVGTALGYYDTDVEIGQKYYYTLVSVGEDGQESVPTGPYQVGPVQDLTPPAPPKEVTFKVALDEDQNQEVPLSFANNVAVRITWKDPDTLDLEFINIYRSATPGELGVKIAQIVPGVESFVDKDLSSGNIYYYLVVSQDKAGNESSYNLVESQMGNPNPFTPLF